jgi:hypothetical protein
MSIQTQFNKAAQASADKALAKRENNQMYMSTTATTASNSINLPMNYGDNNMNNYTYPTTTSAGTHITMNGGVLTTDNTGGLSWNGNQIATYNSKASISRISDMLKDSMTREIILCKTREECQQKYGEYGLKFFDAMLNEVLQEAIKSEEAFLSQLQEEKDKFEKFKQAVIKELGIDNKKLRSFLISNYHL